MHTRFTHGLLQLLFTFFNWKTSKWAYHLLQFFISYWEKFLKLIKFITQSYLLLLNLLLFLSTFSVILNDYFFRWLVYKSMISRFLVLINYIMWSYNLFSASNVFQGPGHFLTLKKKYENKSKVHKVHKIHQYTIINRL